MKQKLPNVEELTVKYALDELDPTEARLLDVAMRDDQDLLIEAESQRRTWAKVRQLPPISAPQGLLDDTVRLAMAARRKPAARILPMAPAWRWAAAACILVAASLPFLPSGESSTAPTAEATLATPDPQPRPQPWVDNQDVIRLQDATASTDSAGRLTPVNPNNTASTGAAPRQLQLTGNQRTP